VATYWIARRDALGLEGSRKKKATIGPVVTLEGYSGWELPFVSAELSAIVEKELRYAMRNAQVRMIALMPVLLIVIRLVNSRALNTDGPRAASDFFSYGSGLLATGGVLYVFLILAGLSCNQFGFEEGGMRTLILSPVDRRKILLGKNIAITFIALILSIALLILNSIVFRDLPSSDLLFVALSFVTFAAISSTVGNWLSIRFPKHMRFGKRLNVSGIAGILLIPLIIILSLPPLLATLVGYFTQSMLNEYLTLVVLALLSIGLYFAIINFHGRELERREIEILDAVREPTDE
jgi:ABC-type transport system involved in multi-copper enzyme maturation permease subunit